MDKALISGSGGLVGSEAVRQFAALGYSVVGIDNDTRGRIFGRLASTADQQKELAASLGKRYMPVGLDIRDRHGLNELFAHHGSTIKLVIHAAGQPSHDWASQAPFADFDINAGGTLNMLEATRSHCPEATFIFMSSNKVYGDTANRLPFFERETRWEIEDSHRYSAGIAEDMSIDGSLHSVFGVSKVSADLMVQEFGRNFGIRTVCFRAGTITGPRHAAVELHGFLAHLLRCAMRDDTYRVIGYGGKQVRDVIHVADLVSAFKLFADLPRVSAVYNIGGGRRSNCSVIEAMAMVSDLLGRPMKSVYEAKARTGDHQWWISDTERFRIDYPGWCPGYDVVGSLSEMLRMNRASWK